MIRNAKTEDLQNLLRLYNDLHPDDIPLPDETTLNAIWSEMLDDPHHHVFLADEDGELVSSCILQVVPNLTRGAKPYGLIENVVTRQDKRGKGYASNLLEHALKTAWKAGCYKVMLLTGTNRQEHEKITALYEKAGFKRGVKTGFIAKPPTDMDAS